MKPSDSENPDFKPLCPKRPVNSTEPSPSFQFRVSRESLGISSRPEGCLETVKVQGPLFRGICGS